MAVLQLSTNKQLTTSNIQVFPVDIQKTLNESSKKPELYGHESSEKPEPSERYTSPVLFNEMVIKSLETDPEIARSLRYYVQEISSPIYLIDYSQPSEINTTSYSSRFGDLKIDQLRKTRLPLGIAVAGLSASVIASIVGLPPPLNWISALALTGPLFISTYGFITQNN